MMTGFTLRCIGDEARKSVLGYCSVKDLNFKNNLRPIAVIYDGLTSSKQSGGVMDEQ